MRVSVIIPTLNEAAHIADCLESLAQNTAKAWEVLVVDGGSSDTTVEQARAAGHEVMLAPKPGRGAQMNYGASRARSEIFLFLHADTLLPAQGLDQVIYACQHEQKTGGAFRRRFHPSHPILAFTSRLADLRSRFTSWRFGDQALFCTSAAFAKAGGFPEWSAFEDLHFSRQLGRIGPTTLLSPPVITSSRRFQKHGPAMQTLKDFCLTLNYSMRRSWN